MTDPAVITLMDPFHDQNYTPTSSGHVMPSVVRQITRTVTINCNQTNPIKSFVIGGFPVGCPSHFHDLPSQYAHKTALQTGPFDSGSRTYGPFVAWTKNAPATLADNYDTRLNAFTVYQSKPSTVMMAPIFILTSTNDTFQFADSAVLGTSWATHAFIPNTATMNGTAVFGDPEIYRSGPTRVISIAYEVHNVSSQLNKQGTCTVGVPPLRVSQSSAVFLGSTNSGTTLTYDQAESAPVVSLSAYPRNSGELLVFPGSRQWESAHGVYAIYPPTEEDSSFEEPVGTMLLSPTKRSYEVTTLGKGTTGSIAGLCVTNATYTNVNPSVGGNLAAGPGSVEPFTPVWAFFEGLNSESVFTITTKITYETIPYPGTDVASLVRYPEPEDVRPIAFRIYREMAPFSYVGENASGKMWRRIAGIGAKIIPVVYPALRSSVPPGARFLTDVAAKEGTKALANASKSSGKKAKKKKNKEGQPKPTRPSTAPVKTK